VSAEERAEWSAKYAEEVHSGVDAALCHKIGAALCRAFLRHAGGAPLPPALERCLVLADRDTLASLPEERRNHLFTARFFEEDGYWRFYALAKVADLVAGCIPALVEGLGVERWKRDVRDETTEAIAAEAKKNPKLASALQALGV
jgi:hypothetical protein